MFSYGILRLMSKILGVPAVRKDNWCQTSNKQKQISNRQNRDVPPKEYCKNELVKKDGVFMVAVIATKVPAEATEQCYGNLSPNDI